MCTRVSFASRVASCALQKVSGNLPFSLPSSRLQDHLAEMQNPCISLDKLTVAMIGLEPTTHGL